jgi:hypothetical protein
MWMAPPDDRLSLARRDVPTGTGLISVPAALTAGAHTIITSPKAGNNRMTAATTRTTPARANPINRGTDALRPVATPEKADAVRTFVCEVTARLSSRRDPERVAPRLAAYHPMARRGTAIAVVHASAWTLPTILQRTS